jgi:hypothetical protein
VGVAFVASMASVSTAQSLTLTVRHLAQQFLLP